MSEETDLLMLAKMSYGTRDEEDAFIVRDKNNKIVVKIHNLGELVELLSNLEPDKIYPSLWRISKKEVESDLALWIHYVLGDAVLSAKIFNLIEEHKKNPVKLKIEIFNLCFNRYLNFQELIDSSDELSTFSEEKPAPSDL